MDTLLNTQLERAYALAFFFHPDPAVALPIAARALGKLRLAERTQARRRYYLPTGRRLLRGTPPLRLRTKVSLQRQQLLQRLVLLECDVVERAQETQRSAVAVGDDELALRFVKHLVRIASRRNTFYVATAIGRILCGYSTAAVLDLYATTIQHPDRTPDDSYMRRVKQTLVRELKERFGHSVRTRTGPRGEEVFETAEPSPHLRRLVLESLERLTPWDTVCPIPPDFNPLTDSLTALRSLGREPDLDHPIEVRRMHSLIHSPCLARLSQGLGLPAPAERLCVPKFFGGSGLGGDRPSTGNRLEPPTLSDDDRASVASYLAFQEERRALPKPAELSVRVDDRELARLPRFADGSAVFDLAGGSELLEVFGLGGDQDVPLALYMIGLQPLFDHARQATEEVALRVGGGRELILTLSRDGAADGALRVQVVCRSATLTGRLHEVLRRALSSRAPAPRWRSRAIPATAVLLVFALSLFVARHRQAVSPLRAPAAPTDSPVTTSTRGRPATLPPLHLASVRRVLVEGLSGPDAEAVADLLRRALGDGGRFVSTSSAEAADVALKGKLEISGLVHRLELRLVDPQGRELWSATVSDVSWSAAAERAVADLTSAAAAAATENGE